MNEEIGSKPSINFKDKPAQLVKLETDKKKKVALQPEEEIIREQDLQF